MKGDEENKEEGGGGAFAYLLRGWPPLIWSVRARAKVLDNFAHNNIVMCIFTTYASYAYMYI